MLTGKQRAYLRSLAHNLRPITQIGKEGITESFLTQLDGALETRELVKVTILETSGLETKDAANAIAKELRAEFVQAIGSKFSIYRESSENAKIELPKPGKRRAK